MKQRIGNVGILNLLNATEESIKNVEKIENIGTVIYRKGQSHLLTALQAGNVGKTVEMLPGYDFYQGVLSLDAAYLRSARKPLRLLVNEAVVVGRDVDEQQLDSEELELIVHGKVYAPPHLTGAVTRLFREGNYELETYTGTPPRFENGKFVLSNAFLKAAEEPLHLVVNGLCLLSGDLDPDLFDRKIGKLEVNGLTVVHEEQEALLYRKTNSVTNGKLEVIPAGYERVTKPLRLTPRSIRAISGKKLYTRKPLIFEPDIPREAAAQIGRIHSESFIICSEEIEDLLYERLDRLETEVLSYTHRFVFIEGEQRWGEAQFRAFEEPVNLIVEGILELDEEVAEETIRQQVKAIDLFGEIRVSASVLKGALQSKLRTGEGQLNSGGGQEPERSALQNIGELSL